MTVSCPTGTREQGYSELMRKAVYQMCPGQTGSILQNIRRSNDPLKLLVTVLTQEGTGKEAAHFLTS